MGDLRGPLADLQYTLPSSGSDNSSSGSSSNTTEAAGESSPREITEVSECPQLLRMLQQAHLAGLAAPVTGARVATTASSDRRSAATGSMGSRCSSSTSLSGSTATAATAANQQCCNHSMAVLAGGAELWQQAGLNPKALLAAANICAGQLFPTAEVVRERLDAYIKDMDQADPGDKAPSGPLAPVAKIQFLAAALCAAGHMLRCAVPCSSCCNNPECVNVTGVSEAFSLVWARACVCGGCASGPSQPAASTGGDTDGSAAQDLQAPECAMEARWVRRVGGILSSWMQTAYALLGMLGAKLTRAVL